MKFVLLFLIYYIFWGKYDFIIYKNMYILIIVFIANGMINIILHDLMDKFVFYNFLIYIIYD